MNHIDDKSKQIAEKIIELDLLRDELFEQLIVLAGNDAYHLLRTLQNS